MADLASHHRTLLGRATIGDQLRRHARTQPNKVAFIAYGADGARTETTYAALDEWASRYAQAVSLARDRPRRPDRLSMARNSVHIVDELPVDPQGRILKHRLRALQAS